MRDAGYAGGCRSQGDRIAKRLDQAQDGRVAHPNGCADEPEPVAPRPFDGLAQHRPADASALPGVRDGDCHLDGAGLRRLEAEVADDGRPSLAVVCLRDQAFAMLVIGTAEELGRR